MKNSAVAVRFLEGNINNLASEYIEDNYEKILRDIKKNKWAANGKEADLLNDVYVSIIEGERNGEGYDPERGRYGYITVEEFVYSRIKGYSKNRKYHDSNIVVNGNLEVAASSDGEEVEDLDGFQKAYALAAEADDLETVEEEISLKQNIEYCIEFNDQIGFDILNLFKNLDLFMNNFNNSIFNRLKQVVKYHDELGEALRQVLSYASKNREKFLKILAEF